MTEEEYTHLQHACLSTGARSISDYARSVMLNTMREDSNQALPGLARRLSDLESQVNLLSETLKTLQG